MFISDILAGYYDIAIPNFHESLLIISVASLSEDGLQITRRRVCLADYADNFYTRCTGARI